MKTKSLQVCMCVQDELQYSHNSFKTFPKSIVGLMLYELRVGFFNTQSLLSRFHMNKGFLGPELLMM